MFFTERKSERFRWFWLWKITLKVRILQFWKRLFIILVDLTMAWFSEKGNRWLNNLICFRQFEVSDWSKDSFVHKKQYKYYLCHLKRIKHYFFPHRICQIEGEWNKKSNKLQFFFRRCWQNGEAKRKISAASCELCNAQG